MNIRNLILVRGLPGSGKSTLTGVLSDDAPVYSVDSYFTTDDGTYDFRYAENHVAYSQCLNSVRNSMLSGETKIFVDNTFTMYWEIEPYFKLASEHGYRVFVVTVENYHGGTNIHGISDEQIEKMRAKYKVRL